MITRRHLKAFAIGTGITALALGVLFLTQHLWEDPEPHRLSHNTSEMTLGRGKIVLSLSSCMVNFAAGPPGAPLRVESSFDADVYTLAQRYEEDNDGPWTWRLDFHEKTVLHVSVVKIWLGKRSPEVTVRVPPELPFDLDATMKGGYLMMDFAGLDLSTADVELDRGVLQIAATEPMDVPMERLGVRARTGTAFLSQIGNASPEELELRHRLGAAFVDLNGGWRNDADIDFRVGFGNGRLRLPRDVRVEGLGHTFAFASGREVPLPTLRVETHTAVSDIRVAY